jgi:RNA polymerase sigma-70 factor (ECF subfamily)
MTELNWDFQRIYEDYRPRILRYLARLVGEYDAEDLTQEVFFNVNRGLTTFRGDSQLSTWIYNIATHKALDKLRSPSYKFRTEISQSEDIDTELAEKCPVTREDMLSPEQQLFLKQRVSCFYEFIENLPANYRVIVALSELEELNVREIAEILGLSLDTVKIRLHRGRVKLLEELKTHCKAEDWI